MKKDLTKLTQDLEELEKRIKAISTSYTTLAQIIAVRDSLDQLKTCFNELTTAIKEDDDDASLEQLNALSTRVTVCETDILALQTDLSSTQEDLATLQTDLSSTNTIVGEHSTTITNLQATQTSLQSAQTNMQTTISNQTNTLSTHTTDITSLKSRMTTAENALANVDTEKVTQIDNRVSIIENDENNVFSSFEHKNLIMHLNCGNGFVKSRLYYYRTNKGSDVLQKFTINYNSSNSGTLTIRLYQDSRLVKTCSVDLSQNPNSFSFSYEHYSNNSYQNYQFEVSSTTSIVFKSIDCFFYGTNIQLFEYDEELKIRCINETIYVTKYIDSKIKFGKFAKDEFNVSCLNVENLPYIIDDSQDSEKIRYACFCGSFIENASRDYTFNDTLVFEKTDNMLYFYNYDTSSQTMTLQQSETFVGGYDYQTCYRDKPTYIEVGNKHPSIKFFAQNYIPLEYNYYNKLKGNSYDIISVRHNYLKNGEFSTFLSSANGFIMYQDGNYYYQDCCTSNKYILLPKCKKIYANNYSRGYGIAFLFDGLDILIYKYGSQEGKEFVSYGKIENCDYASLLYDNKILYRKNGNYYVDLLSSFALS